MKGIFTKNLFRFLTVHAHPGSMRTSNETSLINKQMKNNTFCTCSRVYNLYGHDVKFPFATLFGRRKHWDEFIFFSASELGCRPQDFVGKVQLYLPFKRVEVNAKKFLKSAHSF